MTRAPQPKTVEEIVARFRDIWFRKSRVAARLRLVEPEMEAAEGTIRRLTASITKAQRQLVHAQARFEELDAEWQKLDEEDAACCDAEVVTAEMDPDIARRAYGLIERELAKDRSLSVEDLILMYNSADDGAKE